MCGRTTLFAPPEEIEDRFSASFDYEYEPRYNIAPEGPGVATVPNAEPDTIEQYHWGIIPHWVEDRDDWPEPINARAESVAEKPTFRDAFNKRRCLILADGFYEWTGPAGKRKPHRVVVDDGELFAMAGLWETWEDNGETITSTTIITTDANEVVGQLHDRMPVILAPEEETTWLESEDTDELQELLDPFSDDRTSEYEVSTAVNSPANDSPDLVEPLEGSQSGLGEFG